MEADDLNHSIWHGIVQHDIKRTGTSYGMA